MGFFTREPNTRTHHNLKQDLEELKKSEVTLWNMLNSIHTRNQIPSILENMKAEVQRLKSVLDDIEDGKKIILEL